MIQSSTKINLISITKRIFGNELVKVILQKYYLQTYIKSDIIFIHIPKAAGTSISKIIYGKRNGHLTASVVKDKLKNKYHEKYSFTVCRNPYSRLESAYRFAKLGKTKHGAVTNPNFYQQQIFSTFESFIKQWLINQDLSKIDPIFIPQHIFAFENETLLVNDIFKLENIHIIENKLSTILSENIIIENDNSTFNKNYKLNATKELKDIIYKLYKKDFDLLGYEK